MSPHLGLQARITAEENAVPQLRKGECDNAHIDTTVRVNSYININLYI